jgi:hypothetical protein
VYYVRMCDFLGAHSGVAQDLSLLESGAMLPGECSFVDCLLLKVKALNQ